jgi:hypothetical protein
MWSKEKKKNYMQEYSKLPKRKEYIKNYEIINKEKILKRHRDYSKRNPNIIKNRDRVANLRKHNLTINQFDELLKKQDNRCAICGTHQSELKITLSVDHCHATGKNRGLLCHKCNFGIGHFNDSIDLLLKAKHYLESYL